MTYWCELINGLITKRVYTKSKFKMTSYIKIKSKEQAKICIDFFESIGYSCSDMWKNNKNDFSIFCYLIIHKDDKVIHFDQREFGRAVKFEY